METNNEAFFDEDPGKIVAKTAGAIGAKPRTLKTEKVLLKNMPNQMSNTKSWQVYSV
jgi:hypothetical protein